MLCTEAALGLLLRREGGVRPPVPNELNICSRRESSSEVKYRSQRISTIAVISHPAAMASTEGAGEYISLAPRAAKTTAIAPKTDIWKRFIAIESLASV
jgi:hypothetical protein